MALTYLDMKMSEDFTKRDRLDASKQEKFIEELIKEENLSRFKEETIEKIFYYVFYISKTCPRHKIINLSQKCLAKFFENKSFHFY